MSALGERLSQVQARIAAACARAGRPSDAVKLIAVSKRHPAKAVEEAYRAGVRDFGENYAQELRDKAEQLSGLPGLRWHAIGPLQSNKAKYVARHAASFHALDRLEVAAELSKRRTGAALQCYLEVNLAGEGSKSGVSPEGASALLASVRALPHLEVVGLMALPPLGLGEADARRHFRTLRELASHLSLPELSIGTTSDFELAIEEGATVVRVGEAIFGPRPEVPKP